jgi:hypothetical protein
MENKTNNKSSLSLSLKGGNYPIIVTGLFGIVITILFLYILMPQSFNYALGVSILFTLLLFSFIGTFITFYNSVSSSSLDGVKTNYSKIFYILGGLIGLTSIPFAIIKTLGVFDNKKPDTYMSTILTYGITTLMMIVFGGIYLLTKKDISMPENVKNIYDQRNKYTLLFTLYILSIVLLYVFNPGNIVTQYGGSIMFLSLFIGIIMFSMIVLYNHFFNSGMFELEKMPGWSFFLKSLYALGSLAISGGLIYFLLYNLGVLDQEEGDNWGKIIVNTVLLIGMLGTIYKFLNIGGYLERSSLIRLIANIILYIPCMFLILFGVSGKSSPNDVKYFVLSLSLFAGYFGINYLRKGYNNLKLGGKELTNDAEVIKLSKLSNIAGYQQLNGDDKFNYTYGISFWFNIDGNAPNTNASYNNMTNIFSYGGKPSVNYDATKNTLQITMTNEDNKQKMVHEENDIRLQRWNNVIVNYNGGTLDVFYNGKLVKSVNEIVPYMKYDMLTIGSENGLYGGITNLIYFKEPLNSFQIRNINSMQPTY